ncbi:dermonecrotic toxin domain-containing protein [Pseudomonas sp. S1_E04]
MSLSPSSTPAPLQQHTHLFSNSPATQTEQPPTKAPNDTPAPQASPHEAALLDAYLAAVQTKVQGKTPKLVKVPPESTLGQWLEVYRAQLEHPVVQAWMREQKIDQTPLLTVNPRTGALTANVRGETKTFTLTDNSGWGQVSGPLVAAAKVIAPGNVEKLQMRFGDDYTVVRAGVVANFYGERLPTSLAEARTQIRRLEHNQAFDPIPPDDRLRSASSRSAQSLEQLKLNAETFYTQAPQALAYKRLAMEVADELPNVRAQAKLWAESVIFKLTGKQVDADTLYLNRFSGSQSASTATGWEHVNEEPASSLRLPDALLKNFSEHDWVPGNLDVEAGIYTDGPGQSQKDGYGAHNQFPLAPSALMHASWKTDFQTQMTQKIDNFWNAHGDDYQTAIKGEFTYQARKQLKASEARLPAEQALQAPEHRFSREDYRLVMAAVPNLPLNENTPLSIEQLKAKAPLNGDVQVHAFNIKGFLSNDIVRFSAADGGRQVLYIPGAEPAFLRFDSLEKLDQWVIDQTKDPKKREALLAHFPLISRQDHEPGKIERLTKVFMPVLWFTNAGTKTDGLDTITKNLASGKAKDPTFDGDGSHIKEDVFSAMASASKARMTSDADVMIKSNSEVTRDTWLNDITVAAGLLTKLAPIAAPVAVAAAATGLTELALGAEKQASGDTLAERNDGASKAFDGLLNTLFSVGASATADDPFTPPGESSAAPKPAAETFPIENPGNASVINRLRPSQVGTISQYAVPNGEQLIENATRNAKGMYQVKNAATDTDQWFIRYTDATGVRQVYEIKSDFKLSDDYVQIIDRDTGKPVLTVHADGNGEWVRASASGGLKWPWQRSDSPTSGSESPSASRIAQRFLQADGSSAEGAEKFDDYLNLNEGTDYVFNNTLYQDGPTVRRKLITSWQVDDGAFSVSEGEKAQPSTFSNDDYSSSFAPDLNRERYSVVTKQPGGDVRTKLDYRGDTFEDTIEHRIATFERTIPDPALRARISEVAHQGSSFPALMELSPPALKEGYAVNAGEKSFVITYDPIGKVHTVKASTQWQLRQITDDGLINVRDLDIVSTRTFTLRESNELNSGGYSIDPTAPTKIEVSTPSVV